ncbi:MAG: hypothetical protein LM577_07050 [Thermoproteaceae archaeon]|nr:hypothetical protein [Thermoproteaceae archaeon]
MIVNPVPWMQSCAFWTYRAGYRRIRTGFDTTYQEYIPFYYETLPNGVKLTWSCVPGTCSTYDSGSTYIAAISSCSPTLCTRIYSNLRIYGWPGIQWQQIFINNVVTA